MTQITRKSVPMRGLILLLAMFVGAGLVLSGCGDDDTTTTPAPAPPPPAPEPEPEPEPPAPEAPATPTGLMVSETTETSITWTWDAVEGAIGYAVQVSHDEMFGADDQIVPTAETSFTASDLPPETSVFVRVAAAAGTLEAPLLSGWTTHVTGMSAMPPPAPEPPAPDPVMVTFSLSDDADSMYPMVPDDGTDEDAAMASVNTEIMVESNTTAVITPMFMDGANGVSVDAVAGNTPFSYVSWSILQSAVLDGGATFMVQRTAVGANQEMEPTGDVAYVTCGPFECQDGMDAPAIGLENSVACNAWDPTFELAVGVVDNKPTDDTKDAETGIDLGWMYTSNAGFTATHDIAVTSEKSAAVKASSTMKALAVPDVGTGILGSRVDDKDDNDFSGEKDTADSCETSYERMIGTVQKPGEDQCFRVALNTDNDFLSNYSVSLAPSDTSVSWGEIAWDSFDGLDCPSRDYAAADMVDVCELFGDEVDRLAKSAVEPMFSGKENGSKLAGFNVMFGTAQSHQLKSLWYMQSSRASKAAGDENVIDIYVGDQKNIASGTVSQDGKDSHWIDAVDDDDDPIADFGDLVFIDRDGDDKPDNYPDRGDKGNDRDVKCSDADGGSARTEDADGQDNHDGTLCDATVDFDTSVTFTDGLGLCDSVTVEMTVTCEWDADGGVVVASDGKTRSDAPDFEQKGAGGSKHAYLKCSVG